MSDNSMLLIPDYHAHPEYDNQRALALGNFILDTRPDYVIMLGDWADMPSLSSYDKGKRGFEGRRYQADVLAAIEAQETLWGPVNQYNQRRTANKKAHYNPVRIMLHGNHDEGRIERVTNLNPELHGAISMGDLQYDRYWDYIVPFKQRVEVEGFVLSHYFTSGNSSEAIGGLHQAHNLLVKNGMSSIVGHSHNLDIKHGTRADGSKTLAISAGCYTHPMHIEGWNADSQYKWWNGVVVLNGVSEGYAEEVSTIVQQRLLDKYL